MIELHGVHADPVRSRATGASSSAKAQLSSRERAVLRLAARDGGLAATLSLNGRVAGGAPEMADLLDRLNGADLLSFAGLRPVAGGGSELRYRITPEGLAAAGRGPILH